MYKVGHLPIRFNFSPLSPSCFQKIRRFSPTTCTRYSLINSMKFYDLVKSFGNSLSLTIIWETITNKKKKKKKARATSTHGAKKATIPSFDP